LRTGQRLFGEAAEKFLERKFNPYHDEIGQFTSAPGATVSYGSAGRASAALARHSSGLAANARGTAPLSAVVRDDDIVVNATLESRFDAVFEKPKPGVPKRSQTSRELGSLSAHYETGGRGVNTVSSGMGRNAVPDRGGVSYGSYQLTSQDHRKDKSGNIQIIRNGGNVARFLRDDGKQWAREFAGLAPGSLQFSDIWRRIASRDGASLHAAEHAYTKRIYYDKAAYRIKASTGVDIDAAPLAVRDVLWSTSVQHGSGADSRLPSGATKIFIDAIANTQSVTSAHAPNHYETLIRNLYARRTAYWPSDRSRYQSEMQNALRRLKGE
jgi:hypothetical protein